MSDMAISETVRRFTVDEYHRLADAGILQDAERIELLDGQLVHMSPIGNRHWFVHSRLVRYLNEVFQDAEIVGQGSFPLGEHNEPQPDIAILAPGAYERRRAEPAEILAMIELADSSLAKDLGPKVSLYARYGIPDYVVADLDAGVVVHHRAPRDGAYTHIDRYTAGSTFSVVSFPGVYLDTTRFLKTE